MDKKRKWQFPLILAVIALTVYNILPTLFFYTKPLSSPVSKTAAEEYALTIASRVDKIEVDSIEWLHSYCRLLGIKPHSIATSKTSSDLVDIQCAKSEDAKLLRKFLPRAGLLIPFAPAQLGVVTTADAPKEVTVQRKIGLRLAPLQKTESLFTYVPKEENGAISLEYRTLIENRLEAVTACLTRPPLNTT